MDISFSSCRFFAFLFFSLFLTFNLLFYLAFVGTAKVPLSTLTIGWYFTVFFFSTRDYYSTIDIPLVSLGIPREHKKVKTWWEKRRSDADLYRESAGSARNIERVSISTICSESCTCLASLWVIVEKTNLMLPLVVNASLLISGVKHVLSFPIPVGFFFI